LAKVAILDFSRSLPFLDLSQLDADYDPFADFPTEDVGEYLAGAHIPAFLDPVLDEAAIFYVANPAAYYDFYNEIPEKSLRSLLGLYVELLTTAASWPKG